MSISDWSSDVCSSDLRLAVRMAHLADRRNTQADQIALGTRCIALKISMQAAVTARQVQFVVGLGEMIQTDIYITGFKQSARRHQAYLQTLFRAGQLIG